MFKEVLPLGSAQCSKKVDDGPINMALSKKGKKSYGRTHELINMNHYVPQLQSTIGMKKHSIFILVPTISI